MKKCRNVAVMGALALAVVTGSANAASAEESRWYLGFNSGQASYDVSQSDLDDVALFAFEDAGFGVYSANSSLDDKGTPWSLFGGYKFSQYFAAEVGYANLGKAEYRASGLVNPPGPVTVAPASMGMDLSAKGPTLALVGISPVNEKFQLHAKLGMLFAKTTIDATVQISGLEGSDELSGDSNDLFFGVGAAFHFNEHFSISADWARYSSVGDPDETGEGNIDTITLGLLFRI